MSTAMTNSNTARVSREAKLHIENVCGPAITQRAIEPIIVGIVPPRLTLSPSSDGPDVDAASREAERHGATESARRAGDDRRLPVCRHERLSEN